MPSPRIEVPSEIVQKWQEIVNLLAEIIHVPAALVMKLEPPNIKVFVSSESSGNPYEKDEVACFDPGLYCARVIKSQQQLLVPDALQDEEWKSNPDVKLGMISYLGFPIAWPDGYIFGTICVLDDKRNAYSEPYRKFLLQCRDLLQTDLKLLTSTIREGEMRYRRIIETTNEGVWLLDTKFHTSYVNRQMAEMLGYEPGEMVGRSVFDFYFPEDVDHKRQVLTRRQQGVREQLEERLRRRDGSELWVRMSATPVVTEDCEFDGAFAMVCDITERKLAEEAIRESEQR